MKIVDTFIGFVGNHQYKLRITENKDGLRGSLFNVDDRVRLSSAQFYNKDGDANVERVKEYFGFTEQNSHSIKK